MTLEERYQKDTSRLVLALFDLLFTSLRHGVDPQHPAVVGAQEAIWCVLEMRGEDD